LPIDPAKESANATNSVKIALLEALEFATLNKLWAYSYLEDTSILYTSNFSTPLGIILSLTSKKVWVLILRSWLLNPEKGLIPG